MARVSPLQRIPDDGRGGERAGTAMSGEVRWYREGSALSSSWDEGAFLLYRKRRQT